MQHAKHCEGVIQMVCAFTSDHGDLAIFMPYAPMDLNELIESHGVLRDTSHIQYYAASILRGCG